MDRSLKTPDQLLQYRSLEQILAAKPAGVFSLAPGASVFSALQLMADKGVGFLVVLEGDKLAGVVSERDYARKVALAGKASKDTPVREIMTQDVTTVTPADTVPHCMALMTGKRIRHLPVIKDDRVSGVLSIGDLLKEVISHHEQLIRNLELERMTTLNPDPNSY